MAEAVADRFWASVDKRSYEECWPWTGFCHKGYGRFLVSPGQLGCEHSTVMQAHRVAFFLTYGHWPTPFGLHGCDNPPCCNVENPAHVHAGNQSQNIAEMYARGRGARTIPAGERHPNAKLSNLEVQAIRERHRNGTTQVELARDYGVHPQTIYRYIHSLRYRDVAV